EPLARLDAAVRLVATLVRTGGLKCRREARRVLVTLLASERPEAIPGRFWSGRAVPQGPDETEQHPPMQGGVLGRATGRRAEAVAPSEGGPDDGTAALGPELAAALAQPRAQPGRTLLGLLQGGGPLAFPALAAGLVLVAVGVVFEALLLRSGIDIGRS